MLRLTVIHSSLEAIESELSDLTSRVKATTFEDAFRSKFFMPAAKCFLRTCKQEENYKDFLKSNKLDAIKSPDGFIYFYQNDVDSNYIEDLVTKRLDKFFDVVCLNDVDNQVETFLLSCYHCDNFTMKDANEVAKLVDPTVSMDNVQVKFNF